MGNFRVVVESSFTSLTAPTSVAESYPLLNDDYERPLLSAGLGAVVMQISRVCDLNCSSALTAIFCTTDFGRAAGAEGAVFLLSRTDFFVISIFG